MLGYGNTRHMVLKSVNGWLWDMVYAAGIAESFQNIDILLQVMVIVHGINQKVSNSLDLKGEFDILSASSDSTIHTCNVMYGVDLVFLVLLSISKINLKNKPAGYSPEVLLRDFIKDRNYVSYAYS
jgi:hypothetical protein